MPNWNYNGCEGRSIRLAVFTNAEEVELFLNGASVGRKTVSKERPMPCSVYFDTVYAPGKVEAVSYTAGKEVGRAVLQTTGEPSRIRLIPEKKVMKADGHSLIYVGIEIIDKDGNVVPDAKIALMADVKQTVKIGSDAGSGEGSAPVCAALAGFGSGNPVTEDNYTDGVSQSFRGRAMVVIRSGCEKGTATVTVSAEGLSSVQEELELV